LKTNVIGLVDTEPEVVVFMAFHSKTTFPLHQKCTKLVSIFWYKSMKKVCCSYLVFYFSKHFLDPMLLWRYLWHW